MLLVGEIAVIFYLLAANAASTPISTPRLFLTFGGNSDDLTDESCLIRQSGFETESVDTVQCSLIEPQNFLNSVWIWFKDGRLRGINGLCLKYRGKDTAENLLGSHLYAAPCSHQINSTNELWSIKAGMLWTEALTADDGNESGEDRPIWRRERVKPKQFDEAKLISLQRRLMEAQVATKKERFRQMSRDIPNIPRGLAEMSTTLEITKSESDEVNKVLQNITQLIGEIKADLIGHPTHIGQGVVVEVLETGSSIPITSFISPKYELSGDRLRSAGINPTGPITVRIAGYAVAPEDGSYQFVVADLTSQFRLTANGMTVIDQWAAPAMGDITSKPALDLKEGEEVQLIATTSGVLGVPNFRLLWKTSRIGPEEEVPTESLYPSIIEPLCSPVAFLVKLDCTMTFNKVKVGSEPVTVSCPPGCISEPVKIFGTPTCYAPYSSICAAAIHAGVSGERGGSFLVQIDPTIEKAQYPGVEGFHLTSSDGPAGKGCASIASTIPGMSYGGLHNLEISDLSRIMSNNGSDVLSGIYTIPGAPNTAITAKRRWGSGFLKSVGLTCSAGGYELSENLFDDELGLIDGSFLLIKNSETTNDLSISDILVAVDQQNSPPLLPIKEGWNRYNCETPQHIISLYFKYSSSSDEYQYPSATVDCEETFKSLKSPLQTFSVRCPRFCFKVFAPVIGLFSYSSDSSVCRSAIHAGVIADAGGLVQIIRLPLYGPVKWSSKRNGITSVVDESLDQLFSVDVPSGRKCVYPEHPGGLAHVSLSSAQLEQVPSFRQIVEKDQPVKPHSQDENGEQQEAKMKPVQGSQVNTSQSSTSDPIESPASNLSAIVSAELPVSQIESLASNLSHTASTNLMSEIESLEGNFSQTASSVLPLNQIESAAANLPNYRSKALNFDISKLSYEHGLADLTAGFAALNQNQTGKANEIEKRLLAIEMVEESIREKIKEGEQKIHALEMELIEIESETVEPYTDYDRTMNIFHDWLIIDAGKTSLGPSNWSIEKDKELNHPAIIQKSSITSKSALATALILKGKSLDKGFLSGRIKMSPGGYGTFGFLVKYHDDGNFVVLEISKPSTGGLGSIAFRRIKNRVLGNQESLVSFDVPSGSWISVGVDFGQQNIRAFVDGGKLKAGIELDTPVRGGAVGLMTNALGVGVAVSFESLCAGPLESQKVLAPKFFGTDAEREGPVSIEFVEQPATATPIEGNPSNSVSIPGLPAANVSATSIGSCQAHYNDTLSETLDGWKIPIPTEGMWSVSSFDGESFVIGTPAEKKTSVLYLSRPPCREGVGVVFSVRLRPQRDTRSGLLFRAVSPTAYYAAVLDFTEKGPQVVLIDNKDGTAREFATGTNVNLVSDLWYRLQVEDYNDWVKVLLNQVVVLQTKVPAMTINAGTGLYVENGRSDFQNFNMEIST